MNNKDTYRVPEGFDPHTCMDTIRGLTDAIHHHMTEGPGVERNPERGTRAGLTSLLDQLQHHVHQLHDYLIEIENSTTLELPITDSDFESLHVSNKNKVREEQALYLVG